MAMPKMELMTSHNKADLVNLTMSGQLSILAANNPVRDHKHRMAMSLVHLLSDIESSWIFFATGGWSARALG